MDLPPSNNDLTTSDDGLRLSEITTHYVIFEELLIALAELYGRVRSLRVL